MAPQAIPGWKKYTVDPETGEVRSVSGGVPTRMASGSYKLRSGSRGSRAFTLQALLDAVATGKEPTGFVRPKGKRPCAHSARAKDDVLRVRRALRAPTPHIDAMFNTWAGNAAMMPCL